MNPPRPSDTPPTEGINTNVQKMKTSENKKKTQCPQDTTTTEGNFSGWFAVIKFEKCNKGMQKVLVLRNDNITSWEMV